MCRNIRVLAHFEPPTTDDEIRAVALQYVRKVSGATKPSRANAAAFDAAVAEIAAATERLVRQSLVPAGPPRTREREAMKARARGQKREARSSPSGRPYEPVPAPVERVRFVAFGQAAPLAEAAFGRWQGLIAGLVPGAIIEHVGATSIPGSLTKGDLDICVRVRSDAFAHADAALAATFARNVGSTHTPTYASFTDDSAEPPLGIQLVVADGPEDFFVRLRELLRGSPELVGELNAIRRRHEGGEMGAYRKEKAAFYEPLLAPPALGGD